MLPNTLFGHCRWRALECEIFLVTVAAFLDELTDRPAVIICLIRCIHRRRHADRYYSSFFFITVFFMTHRIQHNRDSWIKWVRCKKLTGPNIRLRLVTLSWGFGYFAGIFFGYPQKKKQTGRLQTRLVCYVFVAVYIRDGPQPNQNGRKFSKIVAQRFNIIIISIVYGEGIPIFFFLFCGWNAYRFVPDMMSIRFAALYFVTPFRKHFAPHHTRHEERSWWAQQ